MESKVLIVGAAGKTGAPVVERAVKAGLAVRAMVRREDERSERLQRLGAEVVVADVHDFDSVRRALAGVDRVYFTYPTHLDHLVEATANVAFAAREAGVRAFVNMSQIIAGETARSPLSRQHWLAEQLLDQADVGAIHIRPTYFMENLLLFNAQSIAEQGKIFLPYGSRKHAPIASDDIARVVVRLLQDPEPHVGERLVLTGPGLFSIQEIAETIGARLDREVEYVDLPADLWRAALTGQAGLPEFLANHLSLAALDHQEGLFEEQTDLVERLTSRPPQSLGDFVDAHRPQFEGTESVFLGV